MKGLATVVIALAVATPAQANITDTARQVTANRGLEMSFEDVVGALNDATIDTWTRNKRWTSRHRVVFDYRIMIFLDYRRAFAYGESGQIVVKRGRAHLRVRHIRYAHRGLSDG